MDLSKENWHSLDYSILEKAKKKFKSSLRKFKNFKKLGLLKRLRNFIEEFTKMLPLIEKLKANPNFKGTHWERLMKDIGQDPDKINFKFFTL